MTPFKLILGSLILLVLSTGCVREEIEVSDVQFDASPEIGAPLAFATIQADQLIQNFDEEGIVHAGEDGTLSIIYVDTLDGLSTGTFLDLDDQHFEQDIDLSELDQASGIEFGTLTITESALYSFESSEGDRLDSIRFDSGVFDLQMNSTGTYPVSGAVRMYSADNTVAFEVAFADDTAPISVSSTSDMGSVLFELVNNDNVSNGVRFEYELTFTDVPNGQVGEIDFEISIEDFSIRHMGGYIAPREVPFEGKVVGIDMFSNDHFGSISIADPRLHLHIKNGFGIELDMQIDQLTGRAHDGSEFVIDGDNIERLPLIEGGQFSGEPAETVITLSNESLDPDLTTLIASSPKEIQADMTVTVNPNNEPSSFVSRESAMDLSFEAEIPIFGSIADFGMVDTTELSVGDFLETVDDLSEIQSLEMRLFVENGFPVDAGVQIVFLDENAQPVDSLFENPELVFHAAPINLTNPNSADYGTADGVTETLTLVNIDRDRIPNLEAATDMIIRVFGNTAGNGDHPIRLRAQDKFEISLAAKTKLDLDEN